MNAIFYLAVFLQIKTVRMDVIAKQRIML